jgi:hypothetical protein
LRIVVSVDVRRSDDSVLLLALLQLRQHKLGRGDPEQE